ncbi:MAG: DNA primase [Planctomycetaceae bacterium]|nr:DNA primase [Planctomycetaceae bacterium]
MALISESRTVIPKNGGRQFVALCPFHDDHNPSMTIDPSRNTYKCWSCGEGGDCFSYVMKMEGLGFRETLEMLAERIGLEVPKSPQGQGGSQSGYQRQTVLEMLVWAAGVYHKTLLNDPAAEPAREYLLDRGFSEETWLDFEMGFHPGPWQWLCDQARGRFTPEQLETARLVTKREQGQGYFDIFRNRILFPISNDRGQTIAFGGRAMPGSEDAKFGKYQNSKESPVFSKSRTLYAFDRAKDAMRTLKRVIVVEGYTDCIALHQLGIVNVVATLGTALTAEHVALIKRFKTDDFEVQLVFDGDQAGQDAANKALPQLLAQDIELKLLELPEGMDPPEFLEQHGLQEFQNLLQQAPDAWEFKYEHLVKTFGTESANAKENIITGMLELLAVAPGIQGTNRENILLNTLCNRMGLRPQQEGALRKQLSKLRAKGAQLAYSSSQTLQAHEFEQQETNQVTDSSENQQEIVDQLLNSTLDHATVLEQDLLEIIFMMPECITIITSNSVQHLIQNRLIRKMFDLCENLYQQKQFTGVDSVMAEVEDPDLKRYVLGIHDSASQKRISEKLTETVEDPRLDVCPAYLKNVIEQLEWEQKESQHRNSTQFAEAQSKTPATINEKMQKKLQDAALFHQQRVTRKTASPQ